MVKTEKHLVNLYRGVSNLKYDFRNYNLTRLVISKIKGDSVLDIGCGNGILLGLLNKKGKKTFGIEPNKELIKLAKRINPKLNIFEGFAEDIDKLFPQKVEAITMIDVLEHIKDDRLQIKKIYNYINRGGQLIIVVPAYQFLYGKRDKNLGHYKRYPKRTLIRTLSKNGFKITYIRYWNMLGFFPYLFYEKILKKESNIELRTKRGKGIFEVMINKILNLWFKYIESNINLGFGLSLICIAERK